LGLNPDSCWICATKPAAGMLRAAAAAMAADPIPLPSLSKRLALQVDRWLENVGHEFPA
jgi:hypothetical protein